MIWYRNTGGFQCNASGAGSEKLTPATGHWCAIWVWATTPDSSGTWETGEVGHPYLDNAATAKMGPVILQPGQAMETSILGATPNSQTTIEYTGWVGDANDGSDLPTVTGGGPISAGSVNLPTPVPVTQESIVGSTFSVAPGNNDVEQVVIPEGAVSVGLMVWSPTGRTDSVTGAQILSVAITDYTYFSQAETEPVPQLFYGGPLIDAPGAKLEFEVSAPNTNAAAISWAPIFFPAGLQVATIDTPPAPWQGPRLLVSRFVTAVGLTTLIPAPSGGLFIRLFTVGYTANPGAQGWLSGTHGGTTEQISPTAAAASTATEGTEVTFDFGGFPLDPDTALSAQNSNAAGTTFVVLYTITNV